MIRYKLIGDYPKREKGDIAYYDSNFRDTNFIWEKDFVSIPEDLQPDLNPDLFEKIQEAKDFIILKFERVDKTLYAPAMWNRTEDGFYAPEGSMTPKITLDSMLHTGVSVDSGDFRIHSVKRKSDREIFTIGDRVAMNKGWEHGAPCLIHSFSISTKGLLKLTIIEDTTKGTYSNFEKFYKVKPKPLFTTEDGVDVYEGDKFYYLDKTILGKNFIYPDVGGSSNKLGEVFLRFSTREAAEDYILLNAKTLSYEDIVNVIPFSSNERRLLKQLIKKNNGLL